MVTVDASVRRSNGRSLVTAVVENEADRARTVTLRATVETMPPRRRGVPERGWDDDEVTVRVPAGARRGVGFATREALEEGASPVEVVERVGSVEPRSTTESDDSPFTDPDALVRRLGESRPPADAVPVAPDRSDTSEDDRATESSPGSTRRGTAAEWEWVGDGTAVERRDDPGNERSASERAATERSGESGASLPGGVVDWLDAVEGRCARIERVTADAPLSTATTALEAAGGMAALAEDADALAAEARRLRSLAERAERLADRASAATLPRDSLEALA